MAKVIRTTAVSSIAMLATAGSVQVQQARIVLRWCRLLGQFGG